MVVCEGIFVILITIFLMLMSPTFTTLYRILLMFGAGFTAIGHYPPQLNWAWNEFALMERLFPSLSGLNQYQGMLWKITQTSNEVMFSVLEVERNSFVEQHQQVLLSALYSKRTNDMTLA